MNTTNNSFDERCYDLLKRVPEGKVTTYGEIAKALNSRAWRAVGSAMAKNKHAPVIPCHRVVRSNGSVGQYAFGADKKIALLIKEGIAISDGKVNELDKFLYRFPKT